MLNENRAPNRILSLKVILNGLPNNEKSNYDRINLAGYGAIFSTGLMALGTGFLIIPALFLVEAFRQRRLADKKSVIK